VQVEKGKVKATETLTRERSKKKKRRKSHPISPTKVNEIGGHFIRPWLPGITTGRIPNLCMCSWAYTMGRWEMKFYTPLCPVHVLRRAKDVQG